MPKGRGANSSRGHYQKDSDEIRDRLGRGAVKLQLMLVRANDLALERRKGDPVADAVKKHVERSEKAAKARRKRRRQWTSTR